MTVHAQSTKKYLPLMLLFASPASAQVPAPAVPSVSTVPAPAEPNPAPAPPSTAPDSANGAKPKPHSFQIPKIGINFGVIMPSSGKTRSRFGNNGVNIGFGIGRSYRPSGTGRISFDFSTMYNKSGDHHEFVAPVGVSYRRAFSAIDLTRGRTFVPYYGLSADLVVVDLRSPEDNVHSRFRLSEGGSVILGSTIGKSGFVEGKYMGIAKIQGFNLSGLKLSVGIRF